MEKEPFPPNEELLAWIIDLWGRTLRLPAPGAGNEFIRSGGNSLLATTIAYEISERWGIDFSLSEVISSSTPSALAVLISEKLNSQRTQASSPPGPAKTDDAEISPREKQMLFWESFDGHPERYHVTLALKGTGAPEHARLQNAFRQIIARHEPLRTAYLELNGKYIRKIQEKAEFALDFWDLSSRNVPDEVTQKKIMEAAARPFNLKSPPLLRAVYIRTGNDSFTLLITGHHIVTDGASMDILVKELGIFFNGGKPPELPCRYRDLILAEKRRLDVKETGSLANYWKIALHEAPNRIDLPYASTHNIPPLGEASECFLELPQATTAAARKFAKESGRTLPAVLLGSFYALLYRNTGQKDLVLGVPVSGRTQPGSAPLIGYFVNTVPLRCILDDEISLARTAGLVQDMLLKAMENQALPLEEILDAIANKDRKINPLFNMAFVFQPNPAPGEKIGTSGFKMEWVLTGRAKFDLMLEVQDDEAGGGPLRLRAEYDRAIFSKDDIERFLKHYRGLLEAALEAPDAAIGKLNYYSREEVSLVLQDGVRDPSLGTRPNLYEMFERQAVATPMNCAVMTEDGDLTYAELLERAGKTAACIREAGIGPGSVVGVHMERSGYLQAAILGILKAGGIYLPLDTDLPDKRIDYMISDSRTRILLTDACRKSRFTDSGLHIVTEKDIDQARSVSPAGTGSDVACLFYTSGTTGLPKGVLIKHDSLSNYLDWIRNCYPLDGTDRVLLKTSIGFDASMLELFRPLLAGAAAVITPPRAHYDMERLLELTKDYGVSVVFFPPSVLRPFLEEAAAGKGGLKIRQVISGGEPLTPTLADKFFSVFPEAGLLNFYGPTETTVNVTHWRCTNSPGETVPIGRPVDGTNIYVLDRSRRPVPIGIKGELYVGGRPVAAGYHTRDELTAERFIDDPFARRGGKMYRTGDLVRLRQDGALEYFGRLDDQVKINGVRVELAEVEHVMAGFPGVTSAAVQAVKTPSGTDQLLGYYTSDRELENGELRAFLREKLPQAYCPASILRLKELPMLPSGKLDRKKLPLIAPSGVDHITPSTRTELRLAEIFEGLLRHSQVGALDNFFALGGNSIMAMTMALRIQEEFACELQLSVLFNAPTVRALAKEIDLSAKQKRTGNARTHQDSAQERSLPGFKERQMLFWESFDDRQERYHVVITLRGKGRLEPARLENAFKEVLSRHENLRTAYQETDGTYTCGVTGTAEFKLEVMHLPGEAPIAETLESELKKAARTRFDLSSPPLLKASYITTGTDGFILMVAAHHLVIDGMSMGILLRDLHFFYIGKAEDLPALPIQYRDAVLAEKDKLEEISDALLDFWKGSLSDAPCRIILPFASNRLTGSLGTADECFLQLDDSLTSLVRGFSKKHGITTSATMLAVFYVLLYRYTGQKDAVVGIPVSGRTIPGTENLIGYFVNTLPLRFILKDDIPFVELAGLLQTELAKAISNQELPLETIARTLGYRNGGANTLYNLMFSFQQDLPAKVRLGEAEAVVSGLLTGPAKVDLLLEVQDNSRLCLRAEYDTTLFERRDIERFQGHYRDLLAACLKDVTAGVGTLNFFGEEDLSLVFSKSADYTNGDQGYSIYDMFRRQAAATPGNCAILAEDGNLTYAELLERAEKTAACLQHAGIRCGMAVGVHMKRSGYLQAAILGILKAGGLYLPLDTDLPGKRVDFILEDSHAGILLTDTASKAKFTGRNLQILTTADIDRATPATPAKAAPMANEIAALLYTSGTTGQPKGVLIKQSSITNYMNWLQNCYPLEESDRVLFKTSIGFDVSMLELLRPLMAGAAAVIAPPGMHYDMKGLWELSKRTCVSAVFFSPSILRLFIDEAAQDTEGLKIREIISAGEPLRPELVNRVLSAFPEAALLNFYGPTETTINVTHWRCTNSPGETVPIGYPAAGANLYILDQNRRPVPTGIKGELYVGGRPVAAGYHSRDELTAERFIDDPFARHGGKMYRTGDLVRLRQDGALEYFGRLDDQVKINGVRVELAEVEHVMAGFPGVTSAAVQAVKTPSGTDQLLGYYTSDRELENGELRAFLRGKLPQAYCPSRFMRLKDMPTLPSGKLDKEGLPDIPASQEGAYVPPATILEKHLAGIFEELLRRKPVGALDNFFELGGNSILLAQCASMIFKRLGIRINISSITENPDCRALALYIEHGPAKDRHETAENALLNDIFEKYPLRPAAEAGNYPLSYAQKRFWKVYSLKTDTDLLTISDSITIPQGISEARVHAAVKALLIRHPALRTKFIRNGDEVRQKVLTQFPLPLKILDRTVAADMDGLEFRTESLKFDLAHELPFRALLARGPGGELRLFYWVHHIAGDGFSMGIIKKALNDFLSGAATLPQSPPELAYHDYSVWEESVFRDLELTAPLLSFWKTLLKKPRPYLKLPFDNDPAGKGSLNCRFCTHVVPGEDMTDIRGLAKKNRTTTYMQLFSAFVSLMSDWCSETDVVVGGPVIIRDHPLLMEMVGVFINTLITRHKVDLNDSFSDLVRQCSGAFNEADRRKLLPFNLLTRMEGEFTLGNFMFSPVSFNYMSFPGACNKPTAKRKERRAEGLFHLNWYLTEYDDALEIRCAYREDFFREQTIRDILARFHKLLVLAGRQPCRSCKGLIEEAQRESRK